MKMRKEESRGSDRYFDRRVVRVGVGPPDAWKKKDDQVAHKRLRASVIRPKQ